MSRNSHKVSVRNLEVNRPLITLRRVGEGNVKMCLKETEQESVNLIQLSLDRDLGRLLKMWLLILCVRRILRIS
jgi:hypothetical protein